MAHTRTCLQFEMSTPAHCRGGCVRALTWQAEAFPARRRRVGASVDPNFKGQALPGEPGQHRQGLHAPPSGRISRHTIQSKGVLGSGHLRAHRLWGALEGRAGGLAAPSPVPGNSADIPVGGSFSGLHPQENADAHAPDRTRTATVTCGSRGLGGTCASPWKVWCPLAPKSARSQGPALVAGQALETYWQNLLEGFACPGSGPPICLGCGISFPAVGGGAVRMSRSAGSLL